VIGSRVDPHFVKIVNGTLHYCKDERLFEAYLFHLAVTNDTNETETMLPCRAGGCE